MEKCRRRWDLADAEHLKYRFMQVEPAGCMRLSPCSALCSFTHKGDHTMTRCEHHQDSKWLHQGFHCMPADCPHAFR